MYFFITVQLSKKVGHCVRQVHEYKEYLFANDSCFMMCAQVHVITLCFIMWFHLAKTASLSDRTFKDDHGSITCYQ